MSPKSFRDHRIPGQKVWLSAISQVVEASSRVAMFPESQRSLLKIVADSSSGRILRGNWIGRDGEVRKINTLAVALNNEMTLLTEKEGEKIIHSGQAFPNQADNPQDAAEEQSAL